MQQNIGQVPVINGKKYIAKDRCEEVSPTPTSAGNQGSQLSNISNYS